MVKHYDKLQPLAELHITDDCGGHHQPVISLGYKPDEPVCAGRDCRYLRDGNEPCYFGRHD